MASDPIAVIEEQIGAASELPEPVPYVRSGEPLRDLMRSIDAARNGNEVVLETAPAATPSAAPSHSDAPPAGPLDAVVGRAILDAVERQPLSGSARAEAVRRLAIAMQNPTPNNLSAVLNVLVTGSADTGQTRE